jgi:8-oxo-dGTP pyrophosphatase MutT (NUDIX family)
MSLRTINREVASVLIYDSAGYLLMGRKKDNSAVFADDWHLPGGGREEGETLLETAIREISEEVGLRITAQQLESVNKGAPTGESDKTLSNGERVHCHMSFNRFKVQLTESRHTIQLAVDGELTNWRWFAPNEVAYDNKAVFYAQPQKMIE